MDKTCGICAEDFTSKKRCPVKCPKCEFECCLSCLKKHCLNGSDPMCMNPDCRAQFPNSFLYQHLPYSFIKGDLKNKRQENLWQREVGMMDSTMPIVSKQIIIDDIEKEVQKLKIQEKHIRSMLHQQILALREARHEQNLMEEGKEIQKIERKNFIRRCTNKGCRGFLNSRYRCELCKTTVCSKCLETKEEGHVCNPEIVKNVELLKKDTKACPNCSEMIHKISGCDQMYCPPCGTAFSWNTGKIVTGAIHNPHYFEYRRNNGGLARQPGDIPCGGIPTITDISSRIKDILAGDPQEQTSLSHLSGHFRRVAQCISHYREWVVPRLNEQVNLPQNRINQHERKKYLMNQIDESKFKNIISKRDTEKNKKKEYLDIYNTFVMLITDQLQILVNENTTTYSQLREIKDECYRIISYINQCFQNIANIYKIKTPLINVPDSIFKEGYGGRNVLNLIEEIRGGHAPQK